MFFNIHDTPSSEEKSLATTNKRGVMETNSTQEKNVLELPEHLYTPRLARAVDLKKLAIVPANTTEALLMEFKVPKGMTLTWRHYALFNDALTTQNSYFKVTVDGNPVLRYHGDPTDGFKLSLGCSADLSNQALMEANIVVRPNQTVRWYVVNTDDVDVTMGVRMVGHLQNGNNVNNTRFGG